MRVGVQATLVGGSSDEQLALGDTSTIRPQQAFHHLDAQRCRCELSKLHVVSSRTSIGRQGRRAPAAEVVPTLSHARSDTRQLLKERLGGAAVAVLPDDPFGVLDGLVRPANCTRVLAAAQDFADGHFIPSMRWRLGIDAAAPGLVECAIDVMHGRRFQTDLLLVV